MALRALREDLYRKVMSPYALAESLNQKWDDAIAAVLADWAEEQGMAVLARELREGPSYQLRNSIKALLRLYSYGPAPTETFDPNQGEFQRSFPDGDLGWFHFCVPPPFSYAGLFDGANTQIPAEHKRGYSSGRITAQEQYRVGGNPPSFDPGIRLEDYNRPTKVKAARGTKVKTRASHRK